MCVCGMTTVTTMQCASKNIFANEKKLITQKFHKLSKIAKPFLKLFSRRARTNAVTPSTCNYNVESMQNAINENEPFRLQFKFHEIEDENARNEALEQRLRESVSECPENFGVQTVVDDGTSVIIRRPSSPSHFAIPVHFVQSSTGMFLWAPLPDADIVQNELISELQTPCQQVPSSSSVIVC